MIAILTVSHGTSDPLGQRAIQGYAHAIHREAEADVRAHAFVDVQQPDVAAALSDLPADATIVIVPLLLSRGYHLGHDLPQAAAPFGERVVIAGALGPDARLAEVLRRRIQEAGAGPRDTLLLAAAGSSDRDGVRDGLDAGTLVGIACGTEVTVGFLSAAEPRLDAAISGARSAPDATARVVAASYLLAPGFFHDQVRGSAADIVTDPLLRPDGPPEPELVALALDRYVAALSESTSP